MVKYWIKNRFLLDLIVPCVLVLLIVFAFIAPMFNGIGEATLMQSIYKNEKMDFDIPSPSFAQIEQLENESFIESVFPYYYTESDVSVNGKTRETNLFFSDAMDKLGQTMYCSSRMIEKSNKYFDNPILVDYQFVQDTGAALGDTVSVTFGTTKIDFQIAAIYETNTYYDGGAIMAYWGGLQKEAIMTMSPNLTYSGAYVQAAHYSQCKQYFDTQYKPYGRLRDASEFATPKAYETHYNAFMSASYANEITDFSVQAKDANIKAEDKMNAANQNVLIACGVALAAMLIFNLLMWVRNSERKYFASRKVRGAGNVVVYYLFSTIFQAAILIGGITAAIMIIPTMSEFYLPTEVVTTKSIVFIIATAIISTLVLVENMLLAKKAKK